MGLVYSRWSDMTTATVGAATGTSAAILSGPGAGYSHILRYLFCYANTTTDNPITLTFAPSGGAGTFERAFTAVGSTCTIDLGPGWMLGTNTGFYAAFSGTSLPSVKVTAIFDTLDRSK